MMFCATPVLAGQEKEAICLSAECVSGWARINPPDSIENISALAICAPNLIIAGNDSGTWRTNYSYPYGNLKWSRLSNIAVTCLASDSLGVIIYAGTYGSGVFKIKNSITTSSGLGDRYVKALARDSRGFLYVVSSPAPTGNYTASCSFDSGATWINIGKPNTAVPVSLSALAVNSNFDLFAGTDKGVFRFIGGYWDTINTGTRSLPDSQINALAIDYNSRIFVGTNHGAFFSTNAGVSWNPLGGPGLPSHITALGAGSTGAIMPVVGSDSGLFEYNAATTAMPKARQISIRMLNEHCLEFHLVKTEVVDVRLYDARGGEKMQLLHGTVSSGTHELRLSNIPDGMYFCRLKIGGNAPITRKIAVLLANAK